MGRDQAAEATIEPPLQVRMERADPAAIIYKTAHSIALRSGPQVLGLDC